MRTRYDILKKDRKGTFQWLETANDIETAKARVLQLSSESADEFVVFRETDSKWLPHLRPCKPTPKYSGNFPSSDYSLLPIDGSMDYGRLFVSLKGTRTPLPREGASDERCPSQKRQ